MKKKSILFALCILHFALLLCYAEDADRLIAEGKSFYQKGNFEQAALSWQKAIELSDKEKHPGKYLDTATHLASAYQKLGYHQRAVDMFRDALPIAQKSQDKYRNILFLNGLADAYLTLGEGDEADKYLSESAEQARQADNPAILAAVLTNVGNVLAADENYEGALSAYEEGVESSAKCKMQSATADFADKCEELKAGLLLNIARVSFLDGEDEDVVSAYDEAASQIGKLPDSYQKTSYLVSLALLARKIHKDMPESRIIGKAVDALNTAKEIAEKSGDSRTLSYTYGYLGQIYEDEKRYAEAMTLTRRAVFYAQQGKYPQILYLWQWQSGRLFNAMGNREDAVKSYKNSIDVLNPIRQELFRGYRSSQDAFNESVKPVYLGLADLLLKQAENIADVQAGEAKLREARDVLELLKTSELQDFFADECVAAVQKKTASVDRTPPKTAVLYPIPLPDRVVLLLTLPHGMKQISVPVDWDTLRERVKLYRHRLQTRTNNRFLHESWQLYDWLIRPIEKELDAIEADTLVVAPDGPLRLFPFSTLNDGQQFLIEKYAIATVPAITLTDPKPIESKNISILLSGLSDGVQDFSPLPSVTAELRDIKEIMSGKILMQNKDYTIDNLTAAFKKDPYTIVHLATHGVFGGTPKESFLLTYNSKMTMDKLEWLIGLNRFKENQVELLTLSACQTALGNERAGLGLAGVAVKAGVRSAIATLWFVDDEATSLAIREFYRQIRTPGISKAKALQNSQKKLIAQLRYRHPLYWGPFLLIGNWL